MTYWDGVWDDAARRNEDCLFTSKEQMFVKRMHKALIKEFGEEEAARIKAERQEKVTRYWVNRFKEDGLTIRKP